MTIPRSKSKAGRRTPTGRCGRQWSCRNAAQGKGFDWGLFWPHLPIIRCEDATPSEEIEALEFTTKMAADAHHASGGTGYLCVTLLGTARKSVADKTFPVGEAIDYLRYLKVA